MTRPRHTRCSATIRAAIVLFGTAAVLLSACGAGDKPAVSPSTILPSPSASSAGGSGHASPSPATSVSPSPSSSSSHHGSGSSGASTKKISDARMRGDILVRLSQDPSLRGIQFEVVVNHGVVSLMGRVKTGKQKHSAEQIAVSEPGVKRVLSYLEVTGGGGY
jgi:hypothetical protein